MNAKKKTTTKKPATKKSAAKKAKGAPKLAKPEGLSALDAAAKVLAEVKEPMSSKDLIEQMAAKGYWSSPAGKTPHATLAAAIYREIQTKAALSRFRMPERGRFAFRAPKGGSQ